MALEIAEYRYNSTHLHFSFFFILAKPSTISTTQHGKALDTFLAEMVAHVK
jgi:hypothetical protein